MPGFGLSGDPEPDDRGQEHGERLAQHGSLGLDAAHPPAQHAEPVDHRRVRIGPDEGVAEGAPVLGREDESGQVLEVHLVADAHARGHEPEATEGALGPAQQLVALHVARVLNGDVAVVGGRVARALHDDRVVDHELDGDERVDLCGVAPQACQRVTHGGEVDDAGHPREVLHEHALGGQGDLVGGVACALAVALGVGPPGGNGDDVVGRDVGAVLVAEQVLEDHLDRVGQAVDLVAVGERPGLDVEDLVAPVADGQRRPGAERVGVMLRSWGPGSSAHSARRFAGMPNGERCGRWSGAVGRSRAGRCLTRAPTPAFGQVVTTS